MSDDLSERVDAARKLAALDTADVVAAILDNTEMFVTATRRFEPPAGNVSRADLEAAARATDAAITAIEARLERVANELADTGRAAPPAQETGTRIDVAG